MAYSFGQGSSNQPAFSFSATPSVFGAQTPQQQPQQPAFGFGTPQQGLAFGQQPSFGQPAPATNISFGQAQQPATGIFGQTSGFGTQAPAFGAPTTALSAFNSGAAPAFGSTAQPTAFGTAGQQLSTISPFGTTNTPANAFGTGAPVTSTFGSFGQPGSVTGTAPSGFSTGNAFGAVGNTMSFGNAGAVPSVNSGTGEPKYSMVKDETGISSETYNSITAMPAYRNFSTEELRLRDYEMGKKQAGTGLGMGATSSFGVQSNTGFGNTGSAFGQSQVGVFGQQQQQQTTTPFGATQSAFGHTQPTSAFSTTPGNTGLFSQTNNTNSVFGAPKPTTGFGLGQTSTTSSFSSAFPTFNTANNTPSAATGTSAFGQPISSGFNTGSAFNTGATGAFGQQQAPGSTLSFPINNAGGTPQKPLLGQPGSAFGTNPATTGGSFAFGLNNNPATGVSQASMGFNGFASAANTANKPSVFGNTTTTTGFGTGLFGQPTQQQQQPAMGGSFGQPAQQSMTFGNTAPGSFNFSGGGLNATSMPGFGATTGFSFQKPATTMAPISSASSFPGIGTMSGGLGGTTGGIFGSSTGNPLSFGTTNVPGMGSVGGLGAGSAFGQPLGFNMAPGGSAAVAAVDRLPYGYSSLFEAVPASSYKPLDSKFSSSIALPGKAKLEAPPSHMYTTPHALTKLKLRGFSQTSVSNPTALKRTLDYPAGAPIAQLRAFRGPIEDAILPPEAYTPRTSLKKLVIQEDSHHLSRDFMSPLNGKIRSSAFGDTPSSLKRPSNHDYGDDAISMSNLRSISPGLAHADLETPSKAYSLSAARRLDFATASAAANSSTVNGGKNANDAANNHTLQRKQTSTNNALTDSYVLTPSVEKLSRMSTEQLRHVDHFCVSVPGVGSVRFLEPVDLSNVPLESIAPGIVRIENMVVNLYPNVQDKPPHGQGLNVPVRIEMYNCWLKDRSTGMPIKDASDPRMENHINKLKERRKTSFVDYDVKTGKWEFDVHEL